MMIPSRPYKLSRIESSPCNLEGANGVTSSYTNNKDLISELPDEIRSSILMRLTLRDAVRTSVLSHRWQKLSSTLPRLRLDCDNLFQISNEGDDTDENHCPARLYSTEKFIQSVDQFLGLSDHPYCKSFKLRFCLGKDFTDDVDRWVRIALGKKCLKTLTVEMSCGNSGSACCNESLIEYNFEHKLAFQNSLRYLHLSGFILGPKFATYSYVGCLEHLLLWFMQISPSCDVQSVLSSMPRLVVLHMWSCRGLPVELDLGSLPFLKCFLMKRCPGVEKLVVSNNKNLTEFVSSTRYLISCDLSGNQSISLLRRCVDTEGLKYVLTYLPGDHPKLKTLNIFSRVDWVTCIPDKIPTFHMVTNLELCLLSKETRFDLLKMVSIIKAFPLLRELLLTTRCSEGSEPGCLPHINYHNRYLKVATIRGYMSSAAEIEFAAFLLKRATTLKHLILEKNGPLPISGWDQNGRQAVADQLQGLSKAVVEIKLCPKV